MTIKIFSIFLTIAFASFEAVAQELHINSVVPIPNKKEIAYDTIYIVASLPDIEKSILREQNKKSLKKSFQDKYSLKFEDTWSKQYRGPFCCQISNSKDSLYYFVVEEPSKNKNQNLFRLEKCLIRSKAIEIQNIKIGKRKIDIINTLGMQSDIDTSSFKTIAAIDSKNIFMQSEIIRNFDQQTLEETRKLIFSPYNYVYFLTFENNLLAQIDIILLYSNNMINIENFK